MSNSNKGDDNEGSRKTMVTMAVTMMTATMWAMATVTRLVGNKEGKSEGGKGKFDSNEGGGC